ncbi:MAG: hypothetical protein ABI321_18075 [Polyangia bacterium]
MRSRSLQRLGPLCFLGFLPLLLGGCPSFGSSSVKYSHASFGDAITNSLNEQLLLNIVRMRYRENPYFLDVTTITTQQTLSATAGINTDLGLASASSGHVLHPSLGTGYSVTPTVIMQPLQGEAFTRKLVSPMTIYALLQLGQAGWRLDRLFALSVDQMNRIVNAPTAAGPTPSEPPRYAEFRALIEDLRILNDANLITMSVNEGGDQGPYLELGSDSQHLVEPARVKEVLDLSPAKTRFRYTRDFLDLGGDRIALRLRSVLSMMFYLAEAVEIPPAHAAAGIVEITHEPDGRAFDWQRVLGNLFRVESSEKEPQNAYLKVRHRDHWFFIRDDDLDSKATFMLLTEIFSMQAGQLVNSGPQLTLPVSH